MKTIITIIAFSFLSNISFGQKNLFYASIEDYYNKKPLDGYEIQESSYSEGTFGTTLKLKKGSESTKVSVSELPAEFFTYASIYTFPKYTDCLMRSYKGDVYVVLVDGPLCYYTKFQYAEKQYFSETITGNLKVYSINWLEKYLKDYDLLDSYKEEHPRVSASTSVGERINNKIQHNVKYINLVNNKLKK